MIEIPARVEFLKKIHLFHGLNDDEFVALAEELDEVPVAKDAVIFKQDTGADAFYFIHGGSVKIVRKVEKKEHLLATLVKYDYFGELALVMNRRRSATATALLDTTLLKLSRADFEKLYKRAPQIKVNLQLAVRSRQLARKLNFKWLRPEEVIYFLARKHPIALWQKLILPIVALAAPLGLFYIWLYVVPFLIIGLLGGIILVLLLLSILWLWLDWRNDYYIVTSQRVVSLEKVIGIYDSRQESPIGTILSVGVEANPIGRILDYGNVVVRTFVGKIDFRDVDHPSEAATMVEEYWNRTKEFAAGVEKQAMKNAIRKRLGLPIPVAERGFGEPTPPAKPAAVAIKRSSGLAAILKFLGADTFKLRYESGDNVVYRKHWFVLIMEAWIPFTCLVGANLLFLARLVQLAYDPDDSFISLQDGFSMDGWTEAFLVAALPFLIWFGYRVLDWSNDKFEVTNDQIIDIDRKPFGTETRNAAPLEGILSTFYERKGLLGNIFNYGTVYISVGGSKLAFEDVMDPAGVQSDIDQRRLARNAKKKEGEVASERDRMAEWLATYHKSSQDFRDEENRNQK
ncbi:MAG: cyclic nucleotide-binding domain-containing protein [Anaerolineales bacterium]